MLPVYTASSYQSVIDKGARTKPWVVLVDTGMHNVRPYVVKMFKTLDIQGRDSVSNEVFGNILANYFGLPVPQAALIEMDESFRMTINNTQSANVYDSTDERVKFGTELLEGYTQFDVSAYSSAQARKMIDIDTLFAFDVLIRNKDRNCNLRPNLLVKSNNSYLIDHEIGFDITEHNISQFQQNSWETSYYKYHIFYKYLHNSRKRTKEQYFNTFEEYLKYLDVNTLNKCSKQLLDYGYPVTKHAIVIQYLTYMKSHSYDFIKHLRHSLR